MAGTTARTKRPSRAPADPPRDEQSQNSDRRAHQAAGLEQRERQKLGGQRREQIEAAAVVIEIHPRQRALVAQTREIEFEQEIPVFGMRIVVPAQAVIAKRQQRDDPHDTEHHDGKPVEDAGSRDFIG